MVKYGKMREKSTYKGYRKLRELYNTQQQQQRERVSAHSISRGSCVYLLIGSAVVSHIYRTTSRALYRNTYSTDSAATDAAR
jgi:hypothetical protein